MSKELISFFKEYQQCGSLSGRRAVFLSFSAMVKEKKVLPTPMIVEEVLQEAFPGEMCFSCNFYGNEFRFFIHCVWTKACEAIRANRPIVEIGPGKSHLLILAALCGATVVGLESAEDRRYYASPRVNIDAMSPGEEAVGSFQMHRVQGMFFMTYQQVVTAPKKAILAALEKMTREGEAPELLEEARSGCMQSAITSSLANRDSSSLNQSKWLYSLMSNRAAIHNIRMIEALLPNHELASAQIFGFMLPANVYGIGYLINRLLDRGCQLLIWGEGSGDLMQSTPIIPSLNSNLDSSVSTFTVIDQSRRITEEDRSELMRFQLMHERGQVDTAAMGRSSRLAVIAGKSARWTLHGHAIDGFQELRASLHLDSTPKELSLMPVRPGRSFCYESEELSSEYRALITKKAVLKAGMVVVLRLLASAGYNGRQGKLIRISPKDPGRWVVKLSVLAGKSKKIRVKPKNLLEIPEDYSPK